MSFKSDYDRLNEGITKHNIYIRKKQVPPPNRKYGFQSDELSESMTHDGDSRKPKANREKTPSKFVKSQKARYQTEIES